jgi:nitroreductase
METLEALEARRNVRTYQDRLIPPEDLRMILEAGRRSPSSKNQQRWDFVVCTDRSQLERLSEVWRGASFVATSALTVALIAPLSDEPAVLGSIHYDLGQVTMAMMTVAADRGIGSGHTYVADQDLARQLLGHPATMFCAWLLAFGYPADRPLTPVRNPNRRDYDDVVHIGHW